MISFKSKGSYYKTENLLLRGLTFTPNSILNEYGRLGVQRLMEETPVDSGLTAQSWDYEIESDGPVTRLIFTNSNVNKGVNIAIILQYGHATRNGGWVEGIDYINPAVAPIFEALADSLWKEVLESG